MIHFLLAEFPAFLHHLPAWVEPALHEVSTEWWTASTGNTLGALLGAGFGGVVGLHGSFVGWLAPRGKARALVVTTHLALLALSFALLLTGLTALGLGQPYHVWFAFVLTGAIGSLILGGLWPVLRLRYAQAEGRKLAAAELRRA